MKTKNILKQITVPVLLLFVLAGCEKDFDSINKDPNAITEVPSDYLLPGAVFSIASNENAFMENLNYASSWTQHISNAFWPSNGSYFYEKSRGYMWDNMYSGPLKDLKTMYELASAENNTTQMAVAQIMSSYAFALLSDCYGPLPYSEALNAETGVNKPVYDSQESVYTAMIDSLSTAISYLKDESEISIQEGYDILFDGDSDMWLRFANSLKLRLMMRISMKVDNSAELSTFINDPSTVFLSSNNDNVVFNYPATAPKNYNPFYSTLSSEATDGGYRLCNTLVDNMIANSDPRLAIYGEENENSDYAGLAAGTGILANENGLYSRIDPRWGESDRTSTFISYSEVMFLLAEAAQRNIIAHDAATYYANAIEANFDELGLSNADYLSYIAEAGVVYNNSLSIIMEQKWLSLFTRGIEAWAEQRRTGYPALVPVAGGSVNVIPYRFQYPVSEEQSNGDNLKNASATLSNGDALDSKIWWIND